MPYTQPGPGDVHVNRPLTNIAIAYMNSEMDYVADKVFPPVPVMNQSNQYWIIPRDAWFRDSWEIRRPGAESAGGGYELQRSTYSCDPWGFHKDVDDQSRANQDSPLSLDMQATEFVTQLGMIRKEVNWMDAYFKTNVWAFEGEGAAARSASLDLTGTTANDVVYWDAVGGTPVEDVRLIRSLVKQRTGRRPNVAVLGEFVYNALVDHDDIIGRLNRGQSSGPAMANRDDLARLFEVDEVLVASAIENTADEGATIDMDFIGGKHALFAYRPPTPGLYVPSAGYTFSWTGYAGSVPNGVEIKRFYMDKYESTRVEGKMAWDQKLVGADLAGMYLGIVQ